MMLVEFDSRGFADAVAAKIGTSRGAQNRALRATGIPTATLHRMLKGTPSRNIGAILSAAAYCDIRLAEFVRVRPSVDR